MDTFDTIAQYQDDLARACVHRAALRAHWETRRPLNDVTYEDIWATWERPR